MSFLFDQLGTAGALTVIGLLILSLTFHEAAHAYVANLRGDPTAKLMGRMTLNPLPHIDPVMTIVVPTLLAMTTGFIFGGAKPVPVDPRRFRSPYRDNAIVAAAGPLSNIFLAIVGVVALQAMARSGAFDGKLLPVIVYWTTYFNVVLAVFNSIPVPPLDGSRVVAWLLPGKLRMSYGALERFGVLGVVVIFVVFREQVGALLGPVVDTVIGWLFELVTLGGIW